MSTETTTTTPTPEPQAIALGIADIAFIVQIIDAASKRGAFAGEELQMIGSYRNKVDAWVKQNTPAAPVAETPAPESATTTDAAAQ